MIDEAKARQYESSEHLDARIALHRRFTPPGHDILDFIWSRYPAVDGHVLEVGCGSGAFWSHPDARLRPTVQATLTDRSNGMVTAARRNLGNALVRRFVVADAAALPFVTGTYDVALAHFMLYHAVDKAQVLGELKRVVAKAGWVGIVLTHRQHMTSIVDVLVEAVSGLVLPPNDSKAFDVDKADPMIRATFGEVARHDYEYRMNVNDAGAIVAYARSLSGVQAANLSSAAWRAYETRIAATIATSGAFEIMKSCSVFVCRPR